MISNFKLMAVVAVLATASSLSLASAELCDFDAVTKNAFDKWDVNEDGRLSINGDEVVYVLTAWGFNLDIAERKNVQDKLQSIDVNADGEVDYNEFQDHARSIASDEEKAAVKECKPHRGATHTHTLHKRRMQEKKQRERNLLAETPIPGLTFDKVALQDESGYKLRQLTAFSSTELKAMVKNFVENKIKPVMNGLKDVSKNIMREIMCGGQNCDSGLEGLIDLIGDHLGALFSYLSGLLLKLVDSIIPSFRIIQSLQVSAGLEAGVNKNGIASSAGAGGLAKADLLVMALVVPGAKSDVNEWLQDKIGFGMMPASVISYFSGDAGFAGNFSVARVLSNAPQNSLGSANLDLEAMAVASAYDALIEFEDKNGNGMYDKGEEAGLKTIELGKLGWQEMTGGTAGEDICTNTRDYSTLTPAQRKQMCQDRFKRDSCSNEELLAYASGCDLKEGTAIAFNSTSAPDNNLPGFSVSVQFETATSPLKDTHGAILTPNASKVSLQITGFPYTKANTFLALKMGVAKAGAAIKTSALVDAKVGNAIKLISGDVSGAVQGYATWDSGVSTDMGFGSVKASEVGEVSGDLGPVGFVGKIAMGADAEAGIQYFVLGDKPNAANIFWDPSVGSGTIPAEDGGLFSGSKLYIFIGCAGGGVLLIAAAVYVGMAGKKPQSGAAFSPAAMEVGRGGGVAMQQHGAAGEWETAQDGEGNMYYHNVVTGQTSWEKPF
jgi:hypothetical protein